MNENIVEVRDHVVQLIDELEEAHSRLSETHHIFGEGRETDRQRGFYRDAKSNLTDAVNALAGLVDADT